MGPASYQVTPNIQKFNHNPSTFDQSARRFKFSQKVEAVDCLNLDDSMHSSGSKVRRVDWRRLTLTGMQGKPSPGPGEYNMANDLGVPQRDSRFRTTLGLTFGAR